MCARQRRFAHFDVVKVLETARTLELEIAGATGVVVGVSGNDSQASEPSYAVMIEPLGRAVMLSADELTPTGQRVEANSVYDGTEVRVTEHGEAVDSSGATE